MSLNKTTTILLADDDSDDRMFFEDAITEINDRVILKTVNNGKELMTILQEQSFTKPDIIFLDLNMPLKNGFECLEEIRNNENYATTFISIYTTSSNQKEIDKTYKKGANLFICKPASFNDLKSILHKVFALKREKYFPQPEKEKFVLVV